MTDSEVTVDLTPATNTGRLNALDILRGFALFGMILVHVHQRIEKPAATFVESLVGWIVWVGVESKSWATFAFLFGVGFAVLLRRLDNRGVSVVPFYLRRLAVLAVFGIIVEVGLGFGILLAYAIWGVPLLFVRRWTDRAVLALAIAAVSIRPLLATAVALSASITGSSPVAGGVPDSMYTAVRLAQQQGHYLQLFSARLAVMWAGLTSWQNYLPDSNLALFIIGLLAVRRGVFDKPRQHVKLIVRWMMFGSASWAACWLVLRPKPFVVFELIPEVALPGADWAIRSVMGLVADSWLCFAYVGGVVLLLAFRPVWQSRLEIVGVAGRMALTNYILQAAVVDILSSNYGLGLRLRPYLVVVGTLVLFAAEAFLSRWWLSRYCFGPLEWVWRSLTYGHKQPMRLRQAELALVNAAAGAGNVPV